MRMGLRGFRSTAAAAVAILVGCAGDGEIEQPTPLYGEVPIEYPLHMWDQDMEGETLLRVRVSDVGAVDSVEVLQSSGHASFDSAAVAGARGLRFTPARKSGKRITVWAEVPVYFSKRPRPDTLGVPSVPGGA
jgi:TonB family protein